MYSIYEKIRNQIETVLNKAISGAVTDGKLPNVEVPRIYLENPREESFGDFSTNIAMQIAKQAKMAPVQIAKVLLGYIQTEGTFITETKVAGPGFINFYLNHQWLYETLALIDERKDGYGEVNIGEGKKVMVEFVSANPTGPLHMGNARGGALGDCIASVLEKCGYDVTREFYVNDAGNQIEKFGASLEARYLQQIFGEERIPFPQDGYMGEDITDHAKAYLEEFGAGLAEKPAEERRRVLVEYALPKNLKRIEDGLARYGIHYDVWFRESSLYDGDVEETLNLLRKKGFILEKDGALWLWCYSPKRMRLIRQNGFLPIWC